MQLALRPLIQMSDLPKITEIIPDDMPEWALEAFWTGQFFRVCVEKVETLQARVKELETIDTASEARIQELEIGVAFLTDAIENGDEIEFLPEKKS